MIDVSSMQNGMHRSRLYGRRRGRALRSGQRALMETLLPTVSFALPERGKLDPRSIFTVPVTAVWLEVGFGAGEHLLFQAEARPHCGLIGSEVFEPGIARLLAAMDERELGNVRLFIDDARLLIAALAPRSLAGAFILFPDPWPKERHKKRRVVATKTLDDLAVAMVDGGELRMATDDLDYAQWIAERADPHPAFERVVLKARPEEWPQTRYEKKALGRGNPARLFLYRRRAR